MTTSPRSRTERQTTLLALALVLLTTSLAHAQPLDIQWTEIAAPYTRVRDSNFGRTVLFDGTRLAITSLIPPRIDTFHWDGTSVTHEAVAMPTSGDTTGFPDVIALDGDRLLGTSHAATPGLYAFAFAGGAWTQSVMLTEPDPMIGDPGMTWVALDGARMAIGIGYWNAARGVVSLVRQTGPLSWTTGNESRVFGAVDYDIFGGQVLLQGDQLLVASIRDHVAGLQSGTVTLYRDVGGSLSPIVTIPNPAPNPDNQFGSAVAMDATHIYIGCRYDDTSASNAGAVYVFDRAGTRLQTITGPAVPEGRFGAGLEVDGTWMVVDAPSNGTNFGALHFYRPNASGTWTLRNTVTEFDARANVSFGNIAVSGNVVIVGELDGVSGGVIDAGRAWIGVMTEPDGGSCGSDTECTHAHCVSGICCNTACGGACSVCGTGTCVAMGCPDTGVDAGTDAAVTPDAAMSPDTGIDAGPHPDSGPLPDSGPRPDGSTSGDAAMGDAGASVPRTPLSCTCRALTRSSNGAGLWLASLASMAVLARKRRLSRIETQERS